MQCQVSLFGTTNYQPSLRFSDCSEYSLRGQTTTQSTLLVAATGTGKTVMMAGIAGHWPTGRVMMISHRFELNMQALRTFENICGCEVDLEQNVYEADQRRDKCHIVVASVQTLVSKKKYGYRMEKFIPDEFGLLMIDEAHRSTAASYRRVVEYFQRNPSLKLLGVTATPDRLDGIGLGNIYDTVACDLNIRWGIDNGWLVPVKQLFVQIDELDLSDIKTTRAGDLDEKQLAKQVQKEKVLHEMAKPIADVCGTDKQGLVFTASVEQAQRLSEVIGRYGRSCESLNGKTLPAKRRAILDGYAKGDIQILVNVGVLTEGFDAPNASVVAIGRPTKSRALYTQMIGRGTRPLPGLVDGAADRHKAICESTKPCVTVLDFVGNSGQHSLVATGDILAGTETPETVERSKHIQRRTEFCGTTLQALQLAKEELRAEQEAKRTKVTVGVRYSLRDTSDRKSVPWRMIGWKQRDLPPTEKQLAFLRKLGMTSAELEGFPRSRVTDMVKHLTEVEPLTSLGKWIGEQRRKEMSNE